MSLDERKFCIYATDTVESVKGSNVEHKLVGSNSSLLDIPVGMSRE